MEIRNVSNNQFFVHYVGISRLKTFYLIMRLLAFASSSYS